MVRPSRMPPFRHRERRLRAAQSFAKLGGPGAHLCASAKRLSRAGRATGGLGRSALLPRHCSPQDIGRRRQASAGHAVHLDHVNTIADGLAAPFAGLGRPTGASNLWKCFLWLQTRKGLVPQRALPAPFVLISAGVGRTDRLARNAWWGPPTFRITVAGVPSSLAVS